MTSADPEQRSTARNRSGAEPEVVVDRTPSPDIYGVSARVRLVAGAACCISGAALVIHILTGSPLWLALAGLGFASSMAVAVVGANEPSAFVHLKALALRGVVVGVVGTAVYDGSRWVLVQVGGLELSPFDALPLFGQALLGADRTGLVVNIAGIGYHLVNGIAFGIAYVIWFGNRRWWWGIVFALGLEAFMLAIYPGWLDPKSIAELTQVSMVGHFAYGGTLGLLASRLNQRQWPNLGRQPTGSSR